MLNVACMWPCGLMDKALVFGTKDCRFESCPGQLSSLWVWLWLLCCHVVIHLGWLCVSAWPCGGLCGCGCLFLPGCCCRHFLLVSSHVVVYVNLISCFRLVTFCCPLGLFFACVCPCFVFFFDLPGHCCVQSVFLFCNCLAMLLSMWLFFVVCLPVHWCGPSWFDCWMCLAMLLSM